MPEVKVMVNNPPKSRIQYIHKGQLVVKETKHGSVITVPFDVVESVDYLEVCNAT